MTATLLEWHSPFLWGPPYAFDILLYMAALGMVLSWRRVRPAHWALFVAFAGASLTAFRNVPLIAFLAPVLIGAYLAPRIQQALRRVHPFFRVWISRLTPLVLAAALALGGFQGWFFQPPVGEWPIPGGAASYLLAPHIPGRIVNTRSQGRHLIG